MGALANATALRHDETFREWVETAIAYQARQVITEAANTPDHAIRLKLAQDTAVTPNIVLPLMLTAVATDPQVAVKGATADLVTEQTVIDKVASVWTTVAQLTFPNG
jgi:hypothetical protein